MISKSTAILALAAFSASIFSGCAASRDLTLADGETRRGDFRTVHGDITVGSGSSLGSAKTIDGNIDIGASSRSKSLASIDGDVTLGPSVIVDGSITTIDGDIRLETGCEIAGNLRTIDGDVIVSSSLIRGDIRTTAGSVLLSDSIVEGAIIVEKTRQGGEPLSIIEIGPDSRVRSVVVKEAPTKVRLRIHESAKVETIKGAEPEIYGAGP